MSRRRLSGRAAAVLSRHGLSHRYGGERRNRLFTGAAAHQEPQAVGVEEWEPGRKEVQLDLAPIVKLISDYALGELISALDRTSRVKERDADLILSTAHKSKGREWGSVRLENDFRHPDSKGYTDEETNLLYVAATRAINTLDITDCDAANIALDAR